MSWRAIFMGAVTGTSMIMIWTGIRDGHFPDYAAGVCIFVISVIIHFDRRL